MDALANRFRSSLLGLLLVSTASSLPGCKPADECTESCCGPSCADDAGASGGGGGGGGGVDAGGSGGGTGGGEGDGGQSADAGIRLRTLTNYRTCRSAGDCPVGLGSCVTAIPLNRVDAQGRTEISVSEALGLPAGEGVCSLPCTSTPEVCGALSLQGVTRDPRPHVCQVVVTGELPYPSPAPAFPFDAQLSAVELSRGAPFGSLCRPPFELAPTIIDGFCGACANATECEQGLCWDLARGDEADGGNGTCLQPCTDAAGCPFGFRCEALGTERACVPAQATCTACADVDGDGRGVGLCGPPSAPVTPYDCDDRQPAAFFDPTDSTHPFPAHCGAFDYNCNGRSDDVEQVGSAAFGSAHCQACNDTCSGPVSNGAKTCAQRDGGPSCVASCELHADGGLVAADCDGALGNGCEVLTTDVARVYYRDADVDGRGDLRSPLFACVAGQPPSGYVSNSADCDDTRVNVHGAGPAGPAAAETCDGQDNDCDGVADDAVPGVGDACASGQLGICAAGTRQCQGLAGLQCVASRMPEAERRDGVDNDCDGQVDEADATDAQSWRLDWDRDTYGTTQSSGTTSGYPNARRACSNPTTPPARYVIDATDCDDSNNAMHPGRPEVCRTMSADFDDDCDGLKDEADPSLSNATTYYRDNDGDGAGLNSVTQRACVPPPGFVSTGGDCNDGNGLMSPLLRESCGDNLDNNCNGQPDEALSTTLGVNTYYTDNDGDGRGTGPGFLSCATSPGTNQAALAGDCNDNDSAMKPGLPEICDAEDNNCNGRSDEGCPTGGFALGPMFTGSFMGYQNHTLGDVWCPPGQMLVGFDTFTGGWFDALRGICASAAFTNNSVTFTNTTLLPRYGSPNTGQPATFECPPGQVISKIDGTWNNWMDRMRFECSAVSVMVPPDTSVSPVRLVFTPGSGQAYGGTGGVYSGSSNCGSGAVGVGFYVYSNNGLSGSVHGFQHKCATLSLETRP